MYVEDESVYYYLTVMNENYPQPAMPVGAEVGIIKGMYRYSAGASGSKRVNLLGSGTILRECIAAATLLKDDFGVEADIYSVTSFSELRREALAVERYNRLHPDLPAGSSFISTMLKDAAGPFVAATDYVATVPDQIRQWIPGRYVVLGTDGFGRSDARSALRRHFEVDRWYIAVAALKALADEGEISVSIVMTAMQAFGIDGDKPNPAKA